MSNFIVAVAVFLITVIVALFAVPYFIDWNGYRGVFEEEATRLMGREVRVGGAVNLHLLPTPYFRFEKVRIADTSVNLQEPFFRADSLTVKLTVPPLFRGAIEANEIEFQRPVLRLALDEKDGWNWQSFGQTLGDAAYLPTNVALSSVRISDGVLALHGPDGAERTRVEGFNAELSAPALAGPYRVRGTYGKGSAEREVRLATARPEADGSVRFKASLRTGNAATTYTLDARLLDLMGRPRVDGELTARLPLAGLLQTADAAAPRRPAGSAAEARPEQGDAAFELKAAVKADAAGATLSDLALSFEQGGRPQLITGELNAQWRDSLNVVMNLSARWLDLDRIAGAGETAGPLDSMIPLALRLRDLLPGEGRSRVSLAIDQANVGREAVSGLQLNLARTDDKLEVEALRLAMPGGSRGELQGVVSGPPDAPVFEGNASLRGSSVVRFLAWATGNALPFDPKGDGTFGIRSRLSIAPGSAVARDIVGDLSGTAIGGAAEYRWEGRPEVSLLVEGPQLDARAFIPAGASLGDIFELILHGPPAAPGATESLGARKPGWRSAQTDAFIRLNAGQLITGARTYRDVAMEVALKGGHLRLPLLRVVGDEGFSIELEGEVADAAARPKGTIRGVVSAESAQSLAPLVELLGVADAFRPRDARAQSMVPLRIAGSMQLGLRTPTSTDLVLDGEANGMSVKVNGRFDGGQAGWRSGPADLLALIEGPDAGAIAALVAPGRVSARPANPVPGRVLAKAIGVPAEGLASIVSVDAGDVGLSFRGKFATTASSNTAAGDLEIKAADATRIAALAGLAPPLRLDGLPIAGTLRLAVSPGTIGFDRMALKVAGNAVSGQLSLTSTASRRRIEARLDVEELSIPRLLAPLLDQRLAAITGAAETAIGQQSQWPDEPFDAAAFDAFEGSIRLTGKRLLLGDGIALGQASLDIVLDGGKADVRSIEGNCLGGRCTATVRLEKVLAGADVVGSVRVAGGRLEALAGDTSWKPLSAGTFDGEIKFSGRGTSPRNLLSVLQGGGTLELANARLATLWPGAVAKAAEAALKADPDKLTAVVRQELATALSAGQLPLPGTVTLEIADGQLRLKPLVADTVDGRATGSADLDLKALTLESEWRLEPKPAAGAPGEKPALPAITVTYRGPVASVGNLEPRIAADGLERELTVRRMERDVEELERLRKLDERRRREDAERLRRQLEQTPAPTPVAPAAPQARPTPG